MGREQAVVIKRLKSRTQLKLMLLVMFMMMSYILSLTRWRLIPVLMFLGYPYFLLGRMWRITHDTEYKDDEEEK